ncbi:hypothetical protein CW306_26910 [Bacillus sp. BA3]|uniref:DUF6366 family protein n=1 Tax=Bacillus sp. BA3 TaxID=2057910 RepID=UPI000C32B60E|nr:DUF6366 family protein [Bacillus sp. BA3]PKF85626.1 hypothetical protein CW306_26910 [Bacillus sp. BA3]
MSEDKETPERRREKLRQKELKRNNSRSVLGGSLADLIGSLGWKGTGRYTILFILIVLKTPNPDVTPIR